MHPCNLTSAEWRVSVRTSDIRERIVRIPNFNSPWSLLRSANRDFKLDTPLSMRSEALLVSSCSTCSVMLTIKIHWILWTIMYRYILCRPLLSFISFLLPPLLIFLLSLLLSALLNFLPSFLLLLFPASLLSLNKNSIQLYGRVLLFIDICGP